ncbi:DUF2189 domain-containing protein [Beijerinckia indica]|uniref:Cytochrome c oxidase subunit I n=1 Tax=Beijerinckia indica subsp. indica (strain ATCC 9039 / DSM 1715 / NCIMB 8712) TaxID=395963 RepID=B2IJ73_BEII9|nr:DUF2189 domain-containing protein [Beijerinckia indica]ACB94836.1 cytochrome c oxidase subunit I [Beijerinckia indica subsp. indica ATCC 9039]
MSSFTDFHLIRGAGTVSQPVVRRIGFHDLREALAEGIDDFWAMPSQIVFIGLLYPIVGIILGVATSERNVLQLLYPLLTGFALVGPFLAIGLYEMSRRREAGLDTSWRHAFEVFRSPSLPAILALGIVLMGLFLFWLVAAETLYEGLFGYKAPTNYFRFLSDVFSTPEGRSLLIQGNAIGFVFAVIAFSISVVSFPLLLDRDVGAAVAVQTSVKAVAKNPIVMAAWAVIVGLLLALGTAILFFGLAIVMPVLAHATWHLYRHVVEPAAPQETNPHHTR